MASLGRGFASIGVNMSREEMEGFCADVDADGGGTISLNELKMAMQQRIRLAKSKVGMNFATNTAQGGAYFDDSEKEMTSQLAWSKILKVAQGDPRAWKGKVESLFDKFGTNGDAEIGVLELGRALMTLGIHLTPDQLNAFKADVDMEGDGEISATEFLLSVRVRLLATANAGSKLPAVIATESAWSKILELHRTRRHLWKPVIVKMFRDYDDDDDGELGEHGQSAAW